MYDRASGAYSGEARASAAAAVQLYNLSHKCVIIRTVVETVARKPTPFGGRKRRRETVISDDSKRARCRKRVLLMRVTVRGTLEAVPE